MADAYNNSGVSPRQSKHASRRMPSIGLLRFIFRYDPITGIIYLRGGVFEGTPSEIMMYSSISQGYIVISVLGRSLRAHRLAWALHYGEWPNDAIDHIDRCRQNNKIRNLRDVSSARNSQNQTHRSQSSTYVGVRRVADRLRWRAAIETCGVSKCLGSYLTEIEAAAAYNAASLALLGVAPNDVPDIVFTRTPRDWRGDKSPTAKLNADKVRDIRRLKGKVHASELARRHGVSVHSIYSINAGRTWAWLDSQIKETGTPSDG